MIVAVDLAPPGWTSRVTLNASRPSGVTTTDCGDLPTPTVVSTWLVATFT